MADSKPTVELWSTQKGKLLKFDVRIENKEIVAENSTTHEVIKFPGGITKKELMGYVADHNKANEGIRAITEEDIKAEKELDEANEKLLESL